MKLRIHENSVRLRLTQKEVAQLRLSGRVDSAICFAPGRMLSYCIETPPEAHRISVLLGENAINVAIPGPVAAQWADSNAVSIQASQPAGANLELQLLVEKDFQCLHRTPEQEPDAYPNPLAVVSA